MDFIASNMNGMPSDRIATILLGRNQLICLSEKPTIVIPEMPRDNPMKSPSRAAEKGAMTKTPQDLLEAKQQKEKRTAEKNARLIKQLSTVIAFNPYAHSIPSALCTTAWKHVVESLIEENVVEDTDGARGTLQRNVNKCVTEYKRHFVMPDPSRRPNRELTEIESLAREIHQLQEKGAPNPMRKKALEKSVVTSIPVDLDVEESKEEVAAGEIAQNLLLVQCVPNEEPGEIVLPSSPCGAKTLPVLAACSDTLDSAEVQYFLLCPTPVTQTSTTISQEQPDCTPRPSRHKPMISGAGAKCALCPYRPSAGTVQLRSVFRFPQDDLRRRKWRKVCRAVDQDFRVRRDSFVCEEHFTPESFGVPRVRNGVESMRLQWFAVPSLGSVNKADWRKLETAAESDEEMGIEEDILEYDNGLPTALDLPSGLPSARDGEKRLLFEEGKENICEYISCSTCGISQEPCWDHAKFIQDKNTNPLARSSLPRQLNFKTDENQDSPLGVLSRGTLRSNTVFGPLRGALCSHISSRFAIHDATSWKCYHLDSDDTCNWMKYVQFADNSQDQNVAVYIKEGQIFFVTTRDIQPDEELKLWYSRKYADSLGLVRKDDLSTAKDTEVGMSVVDDGITQKDDFPCDFVETGENDFALVDFEDIAVLDPAYDSEELTRDSGEHRTLPRNTRAKRKRTVSSKTERTDIGTNREAIPGVDDVPSSEKQSTNLSDLQPTFDTGCSSEVLKSSDVDVSADLEESDQISGSKRKKGNTAAVKYKQGYKFQDTSSVIKFPCSECRIHFSTEQMLILHNYQHSDNLYSAERTCPECGDVFDNLCDLSLHVKEHSKRYFPREKCMHCDAVISYWAMKQHMQRQHPEHSAAPTEKETFPCRKCGMDFATRRAYVKHHKHHAANHGRQVECFYCGETEVAGVAMGQHQLLHEEKDGFHCPKCSKVFKKFSYLRQHYRARHPRKTTNDTDEREETEELPKLKKKRKISVGKKFLADHSTTHKFTCELCRKSYKTEPLLEVHRLFHETESDKSYTGDDIDKACPECGEEFDTLDELFRHVEGYGVTFYAREQCPVCKKFISSTLMQRHMEGNHPSGETGKGEEFPCEVCKKVFPSEIKHRAHVQVHKPKQCLLCAEIFEVWKELGRHAVDTHRQADGFHCPMCDTVFQTFRRLTNHHRYNHDIRSYVSCQTCGKMCKNKQRLYAHMEVEHGSKEFTHECDVCGKKFMRYSTLRNHVASAHTAAGRKKVQGYQVAFMKKGYVAPRKRMLLEEFPFKCETCQVGFLTEGRILRHKVKFHPDEA